MNIVVGSRGEGAAVLIRALEPLSGLNKMIERRGTTDPHKLLSGPAKLTQALMIDVSLNGHNLDVSPLVLKLNPQLNKNQIRWTARIGIKEAADEIKLWRAVISKNSYTSRPL